MAESPYNEAVDDLRRTTTNIAKINDFIISLIEDPAKLEQFREDPDNVLNAADISPEVGELLKLGDRLAVLRAAGGGPVGSDFPLTVKHKFGVHTFTITVTEQ